MFVAVGPEVMPGVIPLKAARIELQSIGVVYLYAGISPELLADDKADVSVNLDAIDVSNASRSEEAADNAAQAQTCHQNAAARREPDRKMPARARDPNPP